MAIGFRKSVFGFNRFDVIEYIEKMHKTFLEKENKLNSNIENLKDELKQSNSEIDALNLKNKELSEELNEFYAKKDEIEKLSENIGKLYLVAQANAQAIMENSKNSAEIIDNEVVKNINAIDDAHFSLSEVKENITEMSNGFVSNLNKLLSSLNTTKEQISINSQNVDDAKKQFDEIYSAIVKWTYII